MLKCDSLVRMRDDVDEFEPEAINRKARKLRPQDEHVGDKQSRSPFLFFGLVFVLSAPFCALGALTDLHVLPGLPIATLIVIAPALAALILRFREAGKKGALELLARSFDSERVKSWVWFLPALFLMPLLNTIAVALSGLAGTAVPVPPITMMGLVFVGAMFFVAALLEELGWTGYATDPLQKRWGALPAGLIIGAVWAAFHFVVLLQAHHSIAWIAWWSVGITAVRVIMVWLYNAAGQSVLIATVFHAAQNISWQLYPIRGSYYNPQVFAEIFTLTAVALVLIAGPEIGRKRVFAVERRPTPLPSASTDRPQERPARASAEISTEAS